MSNHTGVSSHHELHDASAPTGSPYTAVQAGPISAIADLIDSAADSCWQVSPLEDRHPAVRGSTCWPPAAHLRLV